MCKPTSWTPWRGGPRPVVPLAMVRVRFRGGFSAGPTEAGFVSWKHDARAPGQDIVEYEVVSHG